MPKSKYMVIMLGALAGPMAGVAAHAQNNGANVAPELDRPQQGRLLNQDYLTGTGATVPRPGVSQSAGPTPLDRSIQQQDNRIDNSICTGC